MEKSKEECLPEEKKQTLSVNRRKMLKIIAATIGTVEAPLLLPEKWTKPLFEAIIVPAHAATSSPETPDPPDPPVISNCVISARDESEYATGVYSGLLEYEDPACEIDIHYTKLQYTLSWDGSLSFTSGATIDAIPGNLSNAGTPCAGSIGFNFNTFETFPNSSGIFYTVDNATDVLQLQLVNPDSSRLSNVFNASFGVSVDIPDTPYPPVHNYAAFCNLLYTDTFRFTAELYDPSHSPYFPNYHYTSLIYTTSWGGKLNFESGTRLEDIPGCNVYPGWPYVYSLRIQVPFTTHELNGSPRVYAYDSQGIVSWDHDDHVYFSLAVYNTTVALPPWEWEGKEQNISGAYNGSPGLGCPYWIGE